MSNVSDAWHFLRFSFALPLKREPAARDLEEHRKTLQWLLRAARLVHAVAADPDFPDASAAVQGDLARTWNSLGLLLRQTERPQAAEQAHRQALQHLAELPVGDYSESRLREMARTQTHLGNVEVTLHSAATEITPQRYDLLLYLFLRLAYIDEEVPKSESIANILSVTSSAILLIAVNQLIRPSISALATTPTPSPRSSRHSG